jgi:hypothetical protein
MWAGRGRERCTEGKKSRKEVKGVVGVEGKSSVE